MILENHIGALGTLLRDMLEPGYGGRSARGAALLLTLLHRGALTVSRLAAILGVAQPTATRLIAGLERADLLKRAAREGRLVLVTLTVAGRREAKALRQRRAASLASLLKPLSSAEREALGAILDKLLFAATASRAAALTTCRACDHGLCRGPRCPVGRKASALEAAIPCV